MKSKFLLQWLGGLFFFSFLVVQTFSLSIVVYEEHHSVLFFTLVSLATFLPAFLISPYLGVWVDKFGYRLMLNVANIGSFLSILLFLWLLRNDHSPRNVALYAGIFVAAIFVNMYRPALSAMAVAEVEGRLAGRVGILLQSLSVVPSYVVPILSVFLLTFVSFQRFVMISFWVQLSAVLLLPLLLFRSSALPDQTTSEALPANQEPAFACLCQGLFYAIRKPFVYLMALQFVVIFHFACVETTAIPLFMEMVSKSMLNLIFLIAGLGLLGSHLFLLVVDHSKRTLARVLLFSMPIALILCVGSVYRALPFMLVSTFVLFFSFGTVLGLLNMVCQTYVEAAYASRIQALVQTQFSLAMFLAMLVSGPVIDLLIPWLRCLLPALSCFGPGKEGDIGLFWGLNGVFLFAGVLILVRLPSLGKLDGVAE